MNNKKDLCNARGEQRRRGLLLAGLSRRPSTLLSMPRVGRGCRLLKRAVTKRELETRSEPRQEPSDTIYQGPPNSARDVSIARDIL